MHFRALHGGKARGFGIPLIPADERADFGMLRRHGHEAGIAGSEIIFLKEQRIVGDVHLAIQPGLLAVGIEESPRCVIDAGRAFFRTSIPR